MLNGLAGRNVGDVVIIATLLASACTLPAVAEVPDVIAYQGKLLDGAGQPVADGAYDLTFRFYDAATGGTLLLTNQHAGASVVDGIYSVMLGGGAIYPGTEPDLPAVFRNHAAVWISVQVGSDSEMTPRLRVSSAAYAIRSETSDQACGSNLVTNGSFEYWYSGTDSQPDGFESLGTPTVERDAGEADNYHSTAYALKATASGGDDEGSRISLDRLKSDTTYTVSVRVMVNEGDTAVLSTTGGTSNFTKESSSTAWETISGQVTTSSTPDPVVIRMAAKNSGDTVWFDRLMVAEGEGACEFSPNFEDHLYEQIRIGIAYNEAQDNAIPSEERARADNHNGRAICESIHSSDDYCGIHFPAPFPTSVNKHPVVIDSIILDYSTGTTSAHVSSVILYEIIPGAQNNPVWSHGELGVGATGGDQHECVDSPVEIPHNYALKFRIGGGGLTSTSEFGVRGIQLAFHVAAHR